MDSVISREFNRKPWCLCESRWIWDKLGHAVRQNSYLTLIWLNCYWTLLPQMISQHKRNLWPTQGLYWLLWWTYKLDQSYNTVEPPVKTYQIFMAAIRVKHGVVVLRCNFECVVIRVHLNTVFFCQVCFYFWGVSFLPWKHDRLLSALVVL